MTICKLFCLRILCRKKYLFIYFFVIILNKRQAELNYPNVKNNYQASLNASLDGFDEPGLGDENYGNDADIQ